MGKLKPHVELARKALRENAGRGVHVQPSFKIIFSIDVSAFASGRGTVAIAMTGYSAILAFICML